MQPEKLEKTKKRINRINTGIRGAIHGLLFLASFFVIGPVIHEAAHIAILELISCSSRESLRTSFYGIYGSVEPLCSLELLNQGVFYVSGYASTLVIGSILTIIGKNKGNVNRSRDYLASAGSGVLLSMIIPLTAHGDLRILASAAGLPESIGTLISITVLFIASSLGLRALEIDLDVSER